MRSALMVLALALLAPASAQGSGGLTANFGGPGATRPGELHTYVTVARGRISLLQAINRESGAIDRSRRLPGLFGAPQVTQAGDKTGLSWDGKTLVLSDVPHVYPVRETHLLVLGARRLNILQRIDLKGWHSVTGLSRDGSTIFLVHHLADASEVVAYDRADGTRTVIARMAGSPLSRVTSREGRFEFTLYDNLGELYLHALDTQRRTVERIGLPQLEGGDLAAGALRLSGDSVQIGDVAALDPGTGKVTLTRGTPRPTATPRDEGGTSPWPFAALGLLAAGAFVVGLNRRRDEDDVQVIVHHTDP